MTPIWAQRREELLSDCIVSPDIFNQMVDRLGEFVVPYQQALEIEAGEPPMRLYLQGLLSHLPRKNAEEIAALVDVDRQVTQDFLGIVPWDHRPLIPVLVGEVVDQLGEPDGIIAFDPSSFPKRGTRSVGVKRQWCGHRGKVDNCQVGVFMGYAGGDRDGQAPRPDADRAQTDRTRGMVSGHPSSPDKRAHVGVPGLTGCHR